MSVADEDVVHRPTTASIDRRVERLEVAQQETDRKVDNLGTNMDYLKELMNLKFTTIEAGIHAQASKLDAFMAKIESLLEKAMEQAGDLKATPTGRQVDERLSSLEDAEERHEEVLIRLSGFGAGIRLYVLPAVSAVIAVAAFYISLGAK